MKRILLVLAIGMLLMAGTILTATELKVSHPGPIPDEYTLKEEQFTFDSASRALSNIGKYLTSFAKLTELIEAKTRFRQHSQKSKHDAGVEENTNYPLTISLKELNDINNLGWEVQTLGFHNHYITAKGTLLLQQARINELEYELLKLKKSDDRSIDNARKAARESRRLFNEYIEGQSWVD